MKDLYRLARTAVWLAFFGAIYQELKKPPTLRTWHGRVAGMVPYDFRVPTLAKIRKAYWNPDSDRVFSEHVVGVGWAIDGHTAILGARPAGLALAHSWGRVRDGGDEGDDDARRAASVVTTRSGH